MVRLVNVDIDEDLYQDIKEAVKKDRLNFPSIRHFVHKMLMDKLGEVKNGSNNSREKKGF